MNPSLAAAVALAASAAMAGAVLLRTRARVSGGLLLAGVVVLLGGLAASSLDSPLAVVLLTAAGAVIWPAALLAYPEPAWRHPLDRAAWAVCLAAGAGATVAGAWVGGDGAGGAIATAGLIVGPVFIGHLLWRYERADERGRITLLWLALSVGTVSIVYGIAAFALLGSTGAVIGLLLMALIPPALVVGVHRPSTVDVRGLIVQAVVFGVAVLAYMSVFVGLSSLLDVIGVPGEQIGTLAVIAGIAAAGFHPLQAALRGVIDELLFGERPDPLDAATRVAGRIGDDPAVALQAIREALVLPYASLWASGQELAVSGQPVAHTRRLSLPLGDDTVGEIVVGLRPGDLTLPAADERVLRIVAPLLAQTLRARSLAADLAVSRNHAVAAIEDERRRLRRDLHDGLGPTLSGIAFTADAARNSLADPRAADELLRTLRADAVAAIGEVRRLVYAMRPPALDELGLVPALRQWTVQIRTVDGRPLLVEIDAPDDLTGLPAAVEVAAYRIAVEALTNAARHSGSDRAALRLGRAGGNLTVEVRDEGEPRGPWLTGVGLSSMRERAAQVGGTLVARPSEAGGLVTAVLPAA